MTHTINDTIYALDLTTASREALNPVAEHYRELCVDELRKSLGEDAEVELAIDTTTTGLGARPAVDGDAYSPEAEEAWSALQRAWGRLLGDLSEDRVDGVTWDEGAEQYVAEGA